MAEEDPTEANGQTSAIVPGGASAESPAGPDVSRLHELLSQLGTQQQQDDTRKKEYAFWKTQPVAQFDEDVDSLPVRKQLSDILPQINQEGSIDKPKSVDDVRKEPYKLPDSFEWSVCDMNDRDTVAEVFNLLTYNYVEDDEAMFRFKYSREFLQWALQPPGANPEWHLGVRVAASKKLVGFITGVPATIGARGQVVRMAEINFLCVHKKLRSKRLAPVLIKEITRRVNLADVWQAAYTAGVVLPKPVAHCQYWHRSLNPKKLIAVGFSRLAQRMTLARTIKLYKLPDEPVTPGLRPLKDRDIPQVTRLLDGYLEKYALAPRFTAEEVKHYLTPVEDVVAAYVVEKPGGLVTDLCSFYTLPSTVIGNQQYNTLKAAFMYYTVAGETPLLQLMNDALILARNTGHDVFNALSIFENEDFLKPLKFGIGDGKLRYYLYNWRLRQELQPSEVGLILL